MPRAFLFYTYKAVLRPGSQSINKYTFLKLYLSMRFEKKHTHIQKSGCSHWTCCDLMVMDRTWAWAPLFLLGHPQDQRRIYPVEVDLQTMDWMDIHTNEWSLSLKVIKWAATPQILPLAHLPTLQWSPGKKERSLNSYTLHDCVSSQWNGI